MMFAKKNQQSDTIKYWEEYDFWTF